MLALIQKTSAVSIEDRFRMVESVYDAVIDRYEMEHSAALADEQSLRKAVAMLNTRLESHGVNAGASDWQIRFAVVDRRIRPQRVRKR